MMWSFGNWWHAGMGFGFHWVFMLLFWALVIWAGVALVRALSGRAGAEGETPLAILKRRYARGELSREEFETMRRDLE